MDKKLDVRFDRVEKALGTLVDSIAKYNPSIHYAQDLVAADAELGKGLEERTFPVASSCPSDLYCLLLLEGHEC